MRSHRSGLELGMKLTTDKPGMINHLDDFHQLIVRRDAADHQPLFRQLLAILVVKFVAVAMTLDNQFLSVDGPG